MKKQAMMFTWILCAIIVFSACSTEERSGIVNRSIEEPMDAYPYLYEAGNWDYPDYTNGYTSGGNHRFVVKTESLVSGLNRVVIPCRRSDNNPVETDIIVIDASTEMEVSTSKILYSGREKMDLIFMSNNESDIYYVYYLPHTCSGSYYPTYTYLLNTEPELEEWLKSVEKELKDLEFLPGASIISEQSLDDFHSYFPMELIATKDETKEFILANPSEFYLFPEYRHYPIIMRDHLPFRWVRDAASGLKDYALRGEFYTFQIGLFSPEHNLHNLDIEYSGLKSKRGKISTEAFTCFNTGGIDLNGHEFVKDLTVEAGKVQPLWFGIDISEEAKSGVYNGYVIVRPGGMLADTVFLEIEVSDKMAVDHGDNEPEKMSRMRWFNSTVGVDNEYIIDPFIPVEFSDKKMSILGREVSLDDYGFPEQISSFFTQEMTGLKEESEQLLSAPLALNIVDNMMRDLVWEAGSYNIEKVGKGILRWTTTNSSKEFLMEVKGRLEYDGMLDYKICLIAKENKELRDIRFDIALESDVAEYILGLGYTGRKTPDTVEWRWNVKKHQEGAWLGTINKGLQYVLRDNNYERPLNTNFYQDKPLNLPPSWYNGGKGGINITTKDGLVLVKNYSGPRSVSKGDTLNFNIRFLITPFKTLDLKTHFNTRFVHKYLPIDSVKALHGTIVNIHHANEINPYINYPFYNTEKQKAYIDEAHEKGVKVKLYNTIREVSYRAYELQAMRSFGDEILNTGKGGGHSWLQEHLRTDYYSAWHATRVNDAAILNKGNSRWTNYYIEGVNWLAKNQGMDGLYLDDIAFSRATVKRIANVLSKNRGNYVIDLHSANQYNDKDGFINSAFLYMEHFPYVSRLWFGEYFDYYADPDYWLTEVSGLPFGLTGEMLQDGGRPYHGLIYGMTTRVYGEYNPSEIWRVFDEFGIAESEMLGYWVDRSPIKTNTLGIKSTVYVKEDKVMIVLASWSDQDLDVNLYFDWEKLGLDSNNSVIFSPSIEGMQETKVFDLDSAVRVGKDSGLILILKRK